MFKKLINKLMGSKKGANKDKTSVYNVEKYGGIEEYNDLPSNVIRLNDYVERKKSKGNGDSSNQNQGVSTKNDKELEMKKKELEREKEHLKAKKMNLSDRESVNNVLKEKHCLECSVSMSTRRKISAVSDSGTHRYVCCSDCGCIMKLNSDGTLTNTVNILKEISDAYVLFKKMNINPDSYSYTRNGQRHKF